MYCFEAGKVYLEHRKIILESYTVRYRCIRRTEKTAWISRILDDGSEGVAERHKIFVHGDTEALFGSGTGNPRSCWYSSGMNLYARNVE